MGNHLEQADRPILLPKLSFINQLTKNMYVKDCDDKEYLNIKI